MGETIKIKYLFMASLLVCSILLAGCTEESNVVNEETPKTGVLKIISNSPGAKVLVNNEFKGITPLNLTLKEGTYNIKILKDGYEEYTTSIMIKAGETKTITAELKEMIKTGTLIINSEPSGADIYINGEYKGITPLTVTLKTGTYNIKISKSGYYNYTETITLSEGEKVITPKLKKIITNGTLYITSNPSNAFVAIITKEDALNYKEGDKIPLINKIGDTTPIIISLKPGEYYIIISKEGYKSHGEFVTIENGKTTHINVNLEKEPIGTYKNPAKVGDIVRVKYELLGSTYIYEVSVKDYIRGDTANNVIKNANMFNEDPKSGYEYLLVKVKVKYVSGEEPEDVNPYDFKVYYNGAGYDYAWVVLPDDYPELELVRLMPGGEVEGWLAYEVPKNKEVLIAFEKLYEPLCFIKIE